MTQIHTDFYEYDENNMGYFHKTYPTEHAEDNTINKPQLNHQTSTATQMDCIHTETKETQTSTTMKKNLSYANGKNTHPIRRITDPIIKKKNKILQMLPFATSNQHTKMTITIDNIDTQTTPSVEDKTKQMEKTKTSDATPAT